MLLDKKQFIFNTNDNFHQFAINNCFLNLVTNVDKYYNRIAFICIGTDRSTGDCFGPLVGYNLTKCTLCDFDIYGTIHEPVHAKNLLETINRIDLENTLVVAIDSSLGAFNHVGYISMGYGGIKPGLGVGKDLPMVGDIYISGIVNISGFMPTLLLQTTRLGLVYKMSDITSQAIKSVLYRKFLKKSLEKI
jgi:putative sporulation protein YyaC